MALSKQRKEEVLSQYKNWLSQSQAVFFMEYTGATMKDMEMIRAKVRETGGEFHVVKNTLAKLALTEMGKTIPEGLFENSSAVGFAFSDVPATAKALSEVMKNVEAIKVKGGFMGAEILAPSQIKVLADLPPLPVVRAKLLGTLQAPAGKLVRTLAEPARQLASVFRAYSEQSATAA